MDKTEYCLCTLFLLLLYVLVAAAAGRGDGNLEVGFYSTRCPTAESIVFDTVKDEFANNPGVAAGLGCDGSVLIDSKENNVAEKDSPVNNPGLRGFEVIDRAKSKIEAICPKTVSCADILAFAARDSSILASPAESPLSWKVPAGRRDGRISRAAETLTNLPPPFFNVEQLTLSFAAKGLSQEDMVILSGAHTIGQSQCSSFMNRLYNFNKTHPTDPSLDPVYAQVLKAQCPIGNSKRTVAMEDVTPNTLDNVYYDGVIKNKGLLTSDATLLANENTRNLVFANSGSSNLFGWQQKFGGAMVKMGMIDVLTGKNGEIRHNCRVINNRRRE
eukprot:PITA_03220